MNASLPSLLARAVLGSWWLDAVLRWRAADIMRKSRLGAHLPASGLLLDLGAGLGHLAEAVLRGGGRRCVAVDPVWSPPPPLAARLQRGGEGWIRAIHADGALLPFAANSFDGAWCAFVLHHLAPDAQERVLAEAARVLRPGAPFVVIEDTPATGVTVRADRRLNFEDAAAPHHYRSPCEWRAVLRRHGLPPVSETAFTAVFPRATLRRVPHRAFLCRLA